MHEIQRILIERLETGYESGRFPSARELSTRYGISYQTADRLLRELAQQGYLERRHGAGTFVAQRLARPPEKARLIFNRRAEREGSFGHQLLERLRACLEALSVPFTTVWHDVAGPVEDHEFAVAWEVPARLLEHAVERRRFALLLNARPKPGFQATWVDAVAVDDFSGGVCAAQMFGPLGRKSPVAVLGGPRNDPRSQGRIAGFTSVVKSAVVVPAGTWFADRAAPAARRLLYERPSAVFCCNDRLAQAVLTACGTMNIKPPRIIGFDDAPVAQELGLSTVALPWAALVETAVGIIARRLAGDTGHAAQVLLAPRPVRRTSS